MKCFKLSIIHYCFLLFRRQWVREEDLAKDLKLHSKQLRRTLRFLEEEKLVARDHRKEVSLLRRSLLALICYIKQYFLFIYCFNFAIFCIAWSTI